MDADYEELFRRGYAPLVRALAVASGDEQVAADAVQDAFVQALRHWTRIQSYDRPEAWVRRVAVNRMIDASRRRRRRDRHVRAQIDQDVLAVDREPDIDLVKAVAALPEGQRLVVSLHYLADLSVSDVAATMSISPGTVKSQLRDARASLALSLEVVDDGS